MHVDVKKKTFHFKFWTVPVKNGDESCSVTTVFSWLKGAYDEYTACGQLPACYLLEAAEDEVCDVTTVLTCPM